MQSARGKRHAEFLNHVSCFKHDDIEAIMFAILDIDIENGKIRSDRIVPPDQKAFVEQLNLSDSEWMVKLAQYKESIGIRYKDVIPLNDEQRVWFRWIMCETDNRPDYPETRREFRHVEPADEDMSDVPF